MNKAGLITLALSALLVAGCVTTPDGTKMKSTAFYAPQRYGIYLMDEGGPFVAVPFCATGLVTALPGALGSIVIVPPAKAICRVEELEGDDSVAATTLFDAFYFAWVAGDIIATPFWVVKEAFWDCPQWAYRRTISRHESEPNIPEKENTLK